MRSVWQYIRAGQADFARHPFFDWVAQARDVQDFPRWIPALSFWVLSFQDLLRLNESLAVDPKIRALAAHHRLEDRGHDRWFLEDLAAVDRRPHDMRWLFGEENVAARDASFALMSEVFRVGDERMRIVILLTLESAGHVFFDHVVRFLERTGHAQSFLYFSRMHLLLEQGHSMFSDEHGPEHDSSTLSLQLPPRLEVEGRAVVDRIYAAMRVLMGGLLERATRNPVQPVLGHSVPIRSDMDMDVGR